MRRADRLWKELGGPGMPPRADVRTVKSRVDAVLDADPVERRNHMKRKISYVLAVAALAAALTGSALAVGNNLDAISAFFGGDPAPVEDYVDSTPRSVSDANYTFSVDSAVPAGDQAFLIVTVKALNEQTRDFLFSDEFSGIDTFSIWPVRDETHPSGTSPVAGGYSLTPIEAGGGQDSISYKVNISHIDGARALKVRLGWMEKGKVIEVPLEQAPAVTVEMGGSGMGVHTNPLSEASGFTIDRVTLTPLTCVVETSGQTSANGRLDEPRLLFKMADGSVRTQAQMMTKTDAMVKGFDGDEASCYIHSYRFQDVQDLDKLAAVIAFDVEYPLDGSQPRAVAHDAALDPITVTRMDRLTEKSGYSLPVREMVEKLGGTCEWDAKSGDVTCAWRGVSIVLHAGEQTALVDGAAVEMHYAPGVLDGKLCSDYSVFADAWGIETEVMSATVYNENSGEYDIEWGDWLIVP